MAVRAAGSCSRGCGCSIWAAGMRQSSIFLAREFGVEVWATDLWVPASENWQRIRDAELDGPRVSIARRCAVAAVCRRVLRRDRRLDCYSYFGTDDLYLNYLVQFVKPGGQIGIAGRARRRNADAGAGASREFWTQDFWALHSVGWWRRHWERTGLVEIRNADTMSDGWKLWSALASIALAGQHDRDRKRRSGCRPAPGYIRLVGRRSAGVKLEEYAWPDTLQVDAARMYETAGDARRSNV